MSTSILHQQTLITPYNDFKEHEDIVQIYLKIQKPLVKLS